MKKKKNSSSRGWKIALLTGIILMVISYLMYLFFSFGFFAEVYQEIFGIGAGLSLIGVIWALFRIKLA